MTRLILPPLAAFLSLAIAGVLWPGSAPGVASAQESGVPAYIALGDSLAYGVGVEEPSQQGYVALAYAAMRDSDRYGDRGLDLLNLAVPGATSSDLLLEGGQLDAAIDEIEARAGDDGEEENGVEIISLNIGGNDLLSLASASSPCISDPSAEACLEFLGQTLEGLQTNLQMILERLREAAPQAGIYVLNLYNPFSGTGDLREGLADLAVQQFNGVVGAVTADESLSVRMGDVFQLFRGRGDQWIAADGLHPNQQGHQVMAEVLLATIDSREPRIPDELLSVSPGPVAEGGEVLPDLTADGDGDDGIPAWVLLIVVPVAFAAGAAIAGGYFVARGR